MQAVELSRDHKPELEGEQERILKAGGFIHEGRVNGTLNLARAIGNKRICWHYLSSRIGRLCASLLLLSGIQSGPTICRRYGVQA